MPLVDSQAILVAYIYIYFFIFFPLMHESRVSEESYSHSINSRGLGNRHFNANKSYHIK